MKTIHVITFFFWAMLTGITIPKVVAQMALEPEPSFTHEKKITHQKASEGRLFIKVYGFYSLVAPGGFRGQGVAAQDMNQNSSETSKYNSKDPFGSGIRVGGGIGYVVNDFINLGLDGEYVLGATTSESYRRDTQGSTVTEDYKLDYTYRLVNLIPNITFKAVSKPEYYIYNRLGLIVGIPTQLEYLSVYNQVDNGDFPQTYTEKRMFELEKKVGFGYQAALGIQFRISDNLRGFGEVVISNLQLKSDKYTITKASYSYVNTTGTNEQDVPVEVDESLRTRTGINLSIPVNSLGLSAGLALRF